MSGAVTDEAVREFRASLPAAYRDRYEDAEVRAHVATALARGSSRAQVGVCPAPPDALGLCVVAEDSPGVFSNITAALRLQDLDIVSAEAYTRRRADGAPEVVDVFRLRLPSQPQRGQAPGDVAAAVRETLSGLLSGQIDPTQALPLSAAGGADETVATRVRFIEGEDGALSTLEVETGDRAGLLLSLAQALTKQSVAIVRSEVRTFDRRVLDRFTLRDAVGEPISEAHRLQVQVAVLGAIQNPWEAQ